MSSVPALLLSATVEDVLHLVIAVTLLSTILTIGLWLLAGVLQATLECSKPVQLASIPAHWLFTCMSTSDQILKTKQGCGWEAALGLHTQPKSKVEGWQPLCLSSIQL